ncbi:unnamed protein product [Ectocarpus sp. CCAP 1310/34]|nr:unnamed protein product [Ectocarpus sp. CCAP 1310/34]
MSPMVVTTSEHFIDTTSSRAFRLSLSQSRLLPQPQPLPLADPFGGGSLTSVNICVPGASNHRQVPATGRVVGNPGTAVPCQWNLPP